MPRCLLILLAILATACAGGSKSTVPNGTPDNSAAQIITSDLAHFWAAYESGGKDGSASAFQSRYLDVASPGLVDFIRSRGVTAESLAQMVVRYPKYFASIRDANLGLTADHPAIARIHTNYALIKNLYPASVFPPLTLLVGRFSTGGTTSVNGMLIGSEFYSANASTPLDNSNRSSAATRERRTHCR